MIVRSILYSDSVLFLQGIHDALVEREQRRPMGLKRVFGFDDLPGLSTKPPTEVTVREQQSNFAR